MSDNLHRDALEERLRQALNAESRRAPESTLTAEEFRARPLHPVAAGRRAGAHGRWIAVAATVVVGGVVAVLGPGGYDANRAFASWVSSPSAVSPAEVRGLSATCGSGTPVIVDRRGHGAYAVYRDGARWSDCLATITGLSPDKGLPDTWLSTSSVADPPTARVGESTPIVVVSVKSPEGNAVHGAPVTWVSGWVDPVITRITISTSRGSVEPTLKGGLFAAWWPGNDGDTTVIRGYSRDGHLRTTIDQLNCGGPQVTPRVQVPGQAPTGGCG